ncbi:hypothetical protein K438DRAFT_1927306 [Mycena galopus ATCC 62051]|nr:hypothetical protein K438DRAFT_1927306 [Mycena galopus ATCC 62051]
MTGVGKFAKVGSGSVAVLQLLPASLNTRMATKRKLGFQDLVEDVIFLIFVQCDVVDLIAVSETSKFLHRLAFTKSVCYSVVTKLVQRGFINNRPDGNGYLQDLSTEQLIDLVKRILDGPKSWADTHSKSHLLGNAARRTINMFRKLVRKSPVQRPSLCAPPVEARRIVLHPVITGHALVLPTGREDPVKLLPGGEYLFFTNSGCLGCWSVFEDRLIWKHTPSIDALVLDFEVDLLEDGRAVILMCHRTWIAPHIFVEIHTLDLKTGISDLELVSECGDIPIIAACVACSVCDDIAVVHLIGREGGLLLINWRTHSRAMISAHISQMALVPGCLVLALKSACGTHELAVSPLALFPFWEPNDAVKEPSTRISVADLPLFSETIALNGRPYHPRTIWVYENPLQQNRFKIWIYARVDGVPAACSYELKKNRTGVSWRFLSSTPIHRRIYSASMSLSGHSFAYIGSSKLQILSPVRHTPGHAHWRTLEFSGRGHFICSSSFSGALIYLTNEGVVVVYYD